MNYLDVTSLADYIKLSKSAIYKKTAANQIPFIKTGKKLLFKKEAIDKWLESHAFETVDEMQANISDILKTHT